MAIEEVLPDVDSAQREQLASEIAARIANGEFGEDDSMMTPWRRWSENSGHVAPVVKPARPRSQRSHCSSKPSNPPIISSL